MASILDNSGDIIVYATLTTVGRRRATTGTGIGNQITKFCLFDDEIDYGLYDKNHASGTAYSDLEIMQTPIFQPATVMSSIGKYGLMTRAQNNLLYMVQAKPNELIPQQSVRPYKGIYYLAVNDGTSGQALKTIIGEQYVLDAGLQNGLGILIETGIDDTTAGNGDRQTKQRDILANGLGGGACSVAVATNLFSQVLGPARGSYFNNNGGNGRPQINLPLTPVSPTGPDYGGRTNYAAANIRVVDNQMVYRENDNENVDQNSVIASARAGAVKINFQVRSLADVDYSQYGRAVVTSTELFGTGTPSWKIIDTMVSIRFSNGAQEDVPVRIIKQI